MNDDWQRPDNKHHVGTLLVVKTGFGRRLFRVTGYLTREEEKKAIPQYILQAWINWRTGKGEWYGTEVQDVTLVTKHYEEVSDLDAMAEFGLTAQDL